MFRIVIEENTDGQWRRMDELPKTTATGFTLLAIDENLPDGNNCFVLGKNIAVGEVAQMLTIDPTLCWSVLRAVPRALWGVVTGWFQGGETGDGNV